MASECLELEIKTCTLSWKKIERGIKGTEKIQHTIQRISQTQQNVWRGFFSTAKPFVLKGTQKKRKRKEPVISELEKKMTVIWWFSFSRKKQQFFGGQHKCFYKESSLAEATQYDKSPWWVEMRVISLKKRKPSQWHCCHSTKNPRYKMSDFHSTQSPAIWAG